MIAERYDELQSLELLESARLDRAVEPASPESFQRTVLQSVEIVLYNMASLLARGRADLDAQRFGNCATKVTWLRGFHNVLVRLSIVSRTYASWHCLRRSPECRTMRIADSAAFREYLAELKDFDSVLRRTIDTGEIPLARVLRDQSLDDRHFRLIHLMRIGNHESTTWERNLLSTPIATSAPGHAEFTASRRLRETVYEHTLTGDTYFTQFRALHQVPELIGAEINDRLEKAIRAIRRRKVGLAVEHLAWTNALAEAVELCLPAMVDNLSTHDYHQIRENLGLTSGSHSVGLRFHMFSHLYEQLCEEVAACFGDATRDEQLLDLLTHSLLVFRAFIFNWRDEHMHLPRSNLGGASTKSLTGSPDAVAVVHNMRAHARAHDPALALLPLREDAGAEPGELSSYLASHESIDSLVLSTTGRVTQSNFHDVQHRLGVFAGRCPFSKPPRRVVSDVASSARKGDQGGGSQEGGSQEGV